MILFVCVDALHPSQKYFSHVETISSLPGLNQYSAEDKVHCSWAQHIVSIKPATLLSQVYHSTTEPRYPSGNSDIQLCILYFRYTLDHYEWQYYSNFCVHCMMFNITIKFSIFFIQCSEFLRQILMTESAYMLILFTI